MLYVILSGVKEIGVFIVEVLRDRLVRIFGCIKV